MYSYKDLLSFVEQEINEIRWNTKHPSLYEPIDYMLKLGGKRIRPVLALMTIDMLGSYPKHFLQPVLGLEMFHNFTLLHDDVMDHSDMRRNGPTVHKKWNENAAILSGDAMHIAAYQLIAKCNEKQLYPAIQLFSQTAIEVCEGQQLDMEFEKRMDVSVEEYLEMIRLKTGVLLAASLKMGAILSKSIEKDAALLYDFGLNLGMVFQLTDDYLDVYGQKKLFGKQIGTDIINNKKTFMLISAMERASGAEKETLELWLNKEQFDPQEKIKTVTAIFNLLDIKKDSEAMMMKYYEKALSCLSQVDVEEDRKKELYSFAEGIMDRQN